MREIRWPKHAPVPVANSDSFRSVVLAVLKPGRAMTATSLTRAASAIIGPEDPALSRIDLIQLMLDLLISVDKIRTDRYGKALPDQGILSMAGDKDVHPTIRAQLLCSAIAQEAATRLHNSPAVMPILLALDEDLKELEHGYGGFWPHIALMLRLYQVKVNWLGFIEKHFTTATRRLFERRNLMVSAEHVDAFATNMMNVRTHGLQTCYVDEGLLIPEKRAWVYIDAVAIRQLLQNIQAPDLLNHVAMCFLASSENLSNLRVNVVKEGARAIEGLSFSFQTELQFTVRLNGELDIGEVATKPLQELFEQMGCGWAYQPFRFMQLLRLCSMIVAEDAAHPATPPVQGTREQRRGSRKQRTTQAAQRVPDFWVPRTRDLRPDIVLQQLAQARQGVHGFGRHWVPGYFYPRPDWMSTISDETISWAVHEQQRTPKTDEAYRRGHWHCKEQTGEAIVSHRARHAPDSS
jgi:hypothetical protein